MRRANYPDVGSGLRGPIAQRKDAMQALGALRTTEETREQQHLGASIIYKMPAATKAEGGPEPGERNSIKLFNGLFLLMSDG